MAEQYMYSTPLVDSTPVESGKAPLGDRVVNGLLPRPMRLSELRALRRSEQVDAIITDIEITIPNEDYVFTPAFVIITQKKVAAAVFIPGHKEWVKLYSEYRSRASLDKAYERLRRHFDDLSLFTSHPGSIEEAVLLIEKSRRRQDRVHIPGKTTQCPMCESKHEIQLSENSTNSELLSLEGEYVYVECPAATQDELVLEFFPTEQADDAERPEENS